MSRRSFVIPRTGVPPLTSEATRRVEQFAFDRFDRAQDASLSERCIRSLAGPPLTPVVQFPNLQIVQTATHVALLQEEGHDVRLVSLTDPQHLPATLPAWLGDARGRWDGDTLVVDSTNFRDAMAQRRPDTRSDSHLHVIERFTPIGPDDLRYEFTVDDPTVFVSSWTGEFTMHRVRTPLYEVACHEGNYALANMLRGARARTRK